MFLFYYYYYFEYNSYTHVNQIIYKVFYTHKMYRFRKKYTESNFVLIVIDANRFFLFHIHIDKKEEGRNRIKLSIFFVD